jgi:hypothetical protein
MFQKKSEINFKSSVKKIIKPNIKLNIKLNIEINKIDLSILLLFIFLNFFSIISHARPFEESSFEHSETLRIESVSKDINNSRDMYYQGVSGNTNLLSKNRINDSMILSFSNTLDFAGSDIDNYSLDSYAFGFIYNTFTTDYAYDLSNKTSMQLIYEHELLDSHVKPFDDNFENLVDFYLDNSVNRKINDEFLYYKMINKNPLHNRFILYDYDFINQFNNNRISYTIDHAVNRYRYFSFNADLNWRRYRYKSYSRFDDYKSQNSTLVTAKIYQFFPGLFFPEKPQKNKDVPFNITDAALNPLKLIKSFFQKNKVLDYNIDERDLYMEISYTGDIKNIQDYTHGDYKSHTIKGRAGQNITDNMKITVEDSFSIKSYTPQADYYEDFKSNYFNMNLEFKLSESLYSNLQGIIEFQNHPDFEKKDYKRKQLNLNFIKVLSNLTSLTSELQGEWFSYDQEINTFNASYRKAEFNLVFTHQVSSNFTTQIGNELLYYDYYSDTSTIYLDTWLNALSVCGIYKFSSKVSSDFGYKREDYSYTDSSDIDQTTELFFFGTNYKF